MSAEPFKDLVWEAGLPRNLVLAQRPGVPVEDLRDCAVLLMKSGFTEVARRLFEVVEFVGGPSPSNFEGSAHPDESTWDIAVWELSGLLQVAEDNLSGSTTEAAATRTLIEEALDSAPIDLAASEPAASNSELSQLAMAAASNVMRRAFIRRAALFLPPHGDAALFESVQRLGPFGLGVGFQNIGVLSPTWPELGLLITEAWNKAPRRVDLQDTIDRFAVLLSIGLGPRALRTLVDELADIGRTRILRGILLRLQREPSDLVDQELLRTLRDAILDLGDLALGVDAQRCLTEATGQAPAEQFAQGELETSLRNRGSADPLREIMRRSGFASTAAQRARRFSFRRATLMEFQC